MARARLLKPDFFDDEKMCEQPFGARILFQSLWCLADREGRLEYRPSKFFAFAFPAMGNEKLQARARADAAAWLDGLEEAGCVLRYEVDGKHYMLIPSFGEHQKIHPNEPKSILPEPLVTNGIQSNPKVANVAGSGSKAEAEADTEAEAVTGSPEPEPPAHPFSVLYSQKYREQHPGQILKPIVHGRALSLEQKYGAEDCIQVAEIKGWDKDPSYYVGALEDKKNGKQLQPAGWNARPGNDGVDLNDLDARIARL